MAYPVEALLRKPVEYWSAFTAWLLAVVAWLLQDYMLFTSAIGESLAVALLVFGSVRAFQGWRIVRYQRDLGHLQSFRERRRTYRGDGLYIGRGFRWSETHTQRLRDTRSRDGLALLQRVRKQRKDEVNDSGGSPMLHTVGLWEGEQPQFIPIEQLKGHMLIQGATGCGKTRVCESFVTQDIARGDTVIVFDPKGDADLLVQVYRAAEQSGRLKNLQIMHLAHPEFSAKYNPLGSFTRITQVAQRLSEPLPDGGDSAAFQQFAWRFSNIIACALSALGERPDPLKIKRYVHDIEPLFLRYMKMWLVQIEQPDYWRRIDRQSTDIAKKGGYSIKATKAASVARQLLSSGLYDDAVVDGLLSIIEYDRTYYAKIVSSLLPLLEKLTTGKVGELLSPNYEAVDDDRTIIDWGNVVRNRGIVYVGLDALTDPIVAGAVGQAMFDDLTAVAGELYAYGDCYGIESEVSDRSLERPEKVRIHADELSAIASTSVLNLLARGRGAGIELTAYTQTIHDLTTGLGNEDLARVALGNINTLMMMRVRDDQTARLLTTQLARVDIQKLMQVSGAHDSSMPSSNVEFTSSTQQRITTQEVPMLEPADVMKLPIGNAFVLAEGGNLLKTRFPLPEIIQTALPRSIESMASSMRQRGPAPERWWMSQSWFSTNSRLRDSDARPDFAGGEINLDSMSIFEAASTEMGAFSGMEEM